MSKLVRTMVLGVSVVVLLAAPALALSANFGDGDDAVSLLDIERTTYLTKEGSGTLVFFVNTYDDWAPAVLEKGRIRIVMDSRGPAQACCVDGADYVVLMSKPTAPTAVAAAAADDGLVARLFRITDSGLQGMGQVPIQKIAADKVKVSFDKDRIQTRSSGRMLWMVRTTVPQGGSGGSEPGVDVAPASGLFDSGTS